MYTETREMVCYVARCDECSSPFDPCTDYLDEADLRHDMRVMGWDMDNDLCPRCLRAAEEWRPIDRLSTYMPPT